MSTTLAFAHNLWHKSAVPVFLERFILPAFAACVVVIALTNPMGFDLTQRITGTAALILAAYFVAHTIYKHPGKTPPAPSSDNASVSKPDVLQQTAIFIKCQMD